MARNWKLAATLVTLLSPAATAANAQHCTGGLRVEGIVLDPNGAAIAGARVQATDGETATTDTSGRFVFACVPRASAALTGQAEGFSEGTATAEGTAGGTAHLTLILPVARVDTSVQVSDDKTAIDADHGAGTTTLSGKDVQQLADDPDDFQRQLQVLAATSGGSPGSGTITVDGFQNGSALPPKSSIASIRVNPDMFSSEYEDPPYEGGRIEIVTKPGAKAFHGAVFYTDSEGSFNATDPFSVTATPASKRRYGFELNGPIASRNSNFTLALEKRDINEFNVVNAVTLNSAGLQTPLLQTVEAPQRLWIASGRGDWQVTPSDVATLSYSANVSSLGNQGVGGLTLAEAGYGSSVREYDLRLTNTQTFNPNFLHETHIGYTWRRTAQTPTSNAPALNVAGFFNGGGAVSQNLNDRERNLEVDDDALITHGRHSGKVGAQALGIFVHDYDPDTFNGAYVFGGGSAPMLDAGNAATAQITNVQPIEQYRRALLGLPGGMPTTFQQNTGTPLVPLTQWRLALYAQNTVKLAPRLSLSAGLRYALQTTPGSYANFGPRVGLSWAPDKKSAWVLHLRAGLFSSVTRQSVGTQVYRLDGMRQRETLVYSPSFTSPLAPSAGSVQISTVEAFPRGLQQSTSFQAQIGMEHDFPHHWHAQANVYFGDEWNGVRQRNINAPLIVGSSSLAPNPTAALLVPRPLAPNLNVLQYQNSGHLGGNVVFLGLDQHSYKRFGFFAGYVHLNFRANTGRGAVLPQSSYSEQGEFSRPDWQQNHQFFAFGNLNLPAKVELSTQIDASSGNPYNVTTGTDTNGDGNFNDRPSYAPAPITDTGTGVYNTRFGLLSTNAVNGNVPRNLGTMPARIHIDLNASRAFKMGGNKESPRTLTLNARSANLLNHTNVTAVGTVVSSPTFTQSLAAEAARRLEVGARYSF